MFKLISTVFLLSLVSAPVLADGNSEPLKLSSGQQQVPLLELFTSEGCSSCPPADRWISQLKSDPDLWKRFTPIALHVDYWDYIGWKDEFAKSEFGDRQRRYAREGGASAVYTPGLFLNGQAWQRWRIVDTVVSDAHDVGELNLFVSGADVAARFDASNNQYGDLTLHIAILDMNVVTQVRAGENSGKTLHHDFIASGIQSVPFSRAGNGFKAVTQLSQSKMEGADQAIVAWVSDNSRQAPIQSVGGFLPSQ